MKVALILAPFLLLAEENLTNSMKNGSDAFYSISAPIAEFYFKRDFEFEAIQTHPLNQLILEARETGREIEEAINYSFHKLFSEKAKLEIPPNMNKIELNLVIKFRLE